MKTVQQLLRAKYPDNECIVVKEVADSSSRRRYLDFMVINLWESRGQSIIGFEVKSYRSDWLSELKRPEKQELHAPYCDYFYLLTTKEDIAKLEEIPENWGWMVVKNDKLFTMKKAPKLNAKPMSKSMMVSIMRRAADKTDYIHKDDIADKIKEESDRKLEMAKRNRDYDIDNYKTLKTKVEEFEQASGLKLNTWGCLPKELGEAVKLVMRYDLTDMVSSLQRLKKQTQNILQNYEEGLKDFDSIINKKCNKCGAEATDEDRTLIGYTCKNCNK